MAKILLVEDDNNLREIFEMRLQAEGYQTVTASDGEDALATAMKEKPDLIVADVMMPKLSGFEMLETLRAAPEMRDIKVIMMTALGQAEDQARGEKLGVIKYLVKSQVTLEDFARVVRGILPPGKEERSSTTNKQESEKSMPPEDTSATNQPAPGAPADDTDASANPVVGSDSGAPDSGQMSTDEEKKNVDQQIGDFASSSPAPAPDAGDAGSGSDAPVSEPPAEPPASPTDAPPSGDRPAAPTGA
ncbi:hypothetical protein A3E49_03635 [Candidatus Saccharibacteria bacterium RIFCSPHIGHO2_12_FULL_49_19]|nr:MAG: hypothetical protein A2708_02575 [Candidatus Saccharibacteria bacterium RIFCSPHIGHO2_01_FULL_49_21]OGL36234.1 MAG: hypothetical protein A3E49_03635 [Candidatus Saccharibacteria bacterium RIFCSPHIGHO2_12_FULL_49_19]OGL37334.1 MAG: hypothetical protein A3B63_02160 [Candidatus Saccharibacteria bacterium RIFCSPLOWO2_01_FULL_49_22]